MLQINDIHKVDKAKGFSDFYGILAEFGETAEDKIKAVKFKLKERLW